LDKKLLAIFDRDILYASRLMEYFKKSNWDGFDVLLFTRKESLVDLLKYQSIDILLYGGDTLPKELLVDNINYVFYLCTDKKQTGDKQETIYKYQSAGKIASELLSAYTRLEDKYESNQVDDMDFISIFPPTPGPDKISYAWTYAKELSNKKKVLYIAFDLLPTDFLLNEGEKGQSMSELLYYLKESKSDYMDKFKSYISYSEKLSYLRGPIHGFDLLSLSREDIGRLMDDIKNHTDYQTVIFYLGMYTEATMEVLGRSKEICLVTCDLPYEELVIKEWERQTELIGLPIKKLKIDRVKLTGDKVFSLS
jgi:hypothetical protein